MQHTTPSRADARRAPWLGLAAVGVVLAAIIATLGSQSATPSAPSFVQVPPDDDIGAPTDDHGLVPDVDGVVPEVMGVVPQDDAVVTEDDGALPDGVTVWDDSYPGVANLDPDLVQALREAATDAADDGVAFQVNSGWRSPEYQEQLLREAVAAYGSEKEAARWVATANTSAHVSGDAVDIGPFDAMAWLSSHGGRYGLCQIYRVEPWHFELRPAAVDDRCPRMYADASHDPRMRQ
jgi:D-alanyl-D-alanine carboxypeptidase